MNNEYMSLTLNLDRLIIPPVLLDLTEGLFENDIMQKCPLPPLSRFYVLCLMYLCPTITNPPPLIWVMSFMTVPKLY